MGAGLTEIEERFLCDHGGLSRDYGEEAARRNEQLIATEMSELAEHPLDLTGVPHADAVLASLPENMHPLVLNDFFANPVEHLVMDGQRLSVRNGPLRGGDPESVLRYAESYLVA